MKKHILKKNILILVPLALSSMTQETIAQTTSGAGVVCTPYVVNGQSTMRCVGGTGPSRSRPPTVTLPPLNGEVPIITPPAPPPAPIITNPPVIGISPIDNTGGPSAPQPGMQMCEQPGQPVSPGRGPGPCGSTPIPANECSQGMYGDNAITNAWQFNLEDDINYRFGTVIRFGLQYNHAMVFRFRTKGPEQIPNMNRSPWHGLLQVSIDELETFGGTAKKFIALSEKRCDFDYNKVYRPGQTAETFPRDIGCYGTGTIGNIVGKIWAPGHSGNDFTCPLKPNTTYYLSLRYEDAIPTYTDPGGRTFNTNQGKISCGPDSRGPVGTCGQIINFNGN